MFCEEEIRAGCKVTFKPTPRQAERFAGETDPRGNLTGTALRRALGLGWQIYVGGKTTNIMIDAISILSEKAYVRTYEGRLVARVGASKKVNGGWNVKARWE